MFSPGRYPFLTFFFSVGLQGACAPEVEQVLAPAADVAGLYGERGRHGVLFSQRRFRVRVDQIVDAEVLWPETTGAYPAVLLIQGGLVTPERYRWLAIHVASRGHVVVVPDHLLNLAIFAQGNGLDALAALRRASHTQGDPLVGKVAGSPALAIGHSLGGVVAAKAWLGDPEGVSHLVFLASLPDPADDVAARHRGRLVSIIGDLDGMSVAEAVEGVRDFAVPTTMAVVRGMNHYHFTDDASEEELAPGGDAREPMAVVRRRSLFLVDAALDELSGEQVDVFGRFADWPDGLSPAEEVLP